MNRIGDFDNEEYCQLVSKAQLASFFRRLLLKREFAQILSADSFDREARIHLLRCLDALDGERREAAMHLELARLFESEVENGRLDARLVTRSKQIVHECCNACIMTMQLPATVLYRIQKMRPVDTSLLRRARRTLRATMRLAASTKRHLTMNQHVYLCPLFRSLELCPDWLDIFVARFEDDPDDFDFPIDEATIEEMEWMANALHIASWSYHAAGPRMRVLLEAIRALRSRASEPDANNANDDLFLEQLER